MVPRKLRLSCLHCTVLTNLEPPEKVLYVADQVAANTAVKNGDVHCLGFESDVRSSALSIGGLIRKAMHGWSQGMELPLRGRSCRT